MTWKQIGASDNKNDNEQQVYQDPFIFKGFCSLSSLTIYDYNHQKNIEKYEITPFNTSKITMAFKRSAVRSRYSPPGNSPISYEKDLKSKDFGSFSFCHIAQTSKMITKLLTKSFNRPESDPVSAPYLFCFQRTDACKYQALLMLFHDQETPEPV